MPNRRKRGRTSRTVAYVAVSIGILALFTFAYFSAQPHQSKPIILYVNQGNGVVDRSNFVPMLDFASSEGFNTVFFQVYRQGVLLFGTGDLSYFVNETHSRGLRIFFALYITNSSQEVPTSIFGLGEDGISLDMSTLSLGAQQSTLSGLQTAYHGETAVTTTDLVSPLKPDLLVLETYGLGAEQYVRHGMVASVGIFATTSKEDYQSQFQYALNNSDGVMVFDYAGLLKSGY
jgi:hypothetical protein